MSLITSASLAAYVRAESTTENSLMDQLVSRSIAVVESYINRPIVSVQKTFYDDPPYGGSRLVIEQYPVSGNVVVSDVDGVTVDSAEYTVYTQSGIVRAKDGTSFDNGPYTIVAYVGMDQHQDYNRRIEGVINSAILDIAVDLYSRRSAMVSSEGAAETNLSYLSVPIPPRTQAMLNTIKPLGLPR